MSSGSLEQQHVSKHKNNDNEDLISAITTAASARLAAAAAERDNEKGKDNKSPKHAKKSYPSVGIRVRVAKDGSIIRPQRAQATTTGSGGQMQAPPPRPNAEAVLAFQQQQKQKLQASASTQIAHAATGGSQQSQTSSQSSSPGNMTTMQDRSRSSSFSHVQPQQLQNEDVSSQSMDLSLSFVSSPEQMDMQAMPPNNHDTNSQRQHLRHQSFSSAHMYNTQPQPLYEQSQSSFEPMNGSSGTSTEGMLYNQVSSPFPNGSGAVSASSSPFTTTSSGHPSTPTFPHLSSPPLFGPPPPTSTTSPATYYRGPSSFTSYATNSPTMHSSNLSTLQQHGNGSGMPLMDMGMDSSMMPTPILETPIYDKSQQQQHAIYDPKPSVVDNISRHHHNHHQQHFQQNPSYDAGSQNHRHMVPVIPPWSSPPPSQQQQSSMSAQNGQSFWNNGEGFKFYP